MHILSPFSVEIINSRPSSFPKSFSFLFFLLSQWTNSIFLSIYLPLHRNETWLGNPLRNFINFDQKFFNCQKEKFFSRTLSALFLWLKIKSHIYLKARIMKNSHSCLLRKKAAWSNTNTSLNVLYLRWVYLPGVVTWILGLSVHFN